MEWKAEKLCSYRGEYELLIERFKNGYECAQKSENWKWRVIHSGVILSQGNATNMEGAQELAEANIPMNG